MDEFGGIEVWRGGVNTWECDEMGHLNVRFYVARAMEGLVSLASALGLPGAFRSNSPATLVVRDHHIRFLREARAGTPLHMYAGLLELGESDARIAQLMIHSNTGEIAAAFQTRFEHVTAQDGRAFPWSASTRLAAGPLAMTVPDRAAPRSLDLRASPGTARLAQADQMGLISLAGGAVTAADCDVFGRMRADVCIGRISDGIPALAAALRADDAGRPSPRGVGVGGAVLEYRVAYHAWPRAGERLVVRSGLKAVGERTFNYVHWVLDPDSGRPWATAEAVAISLDLEARKIIPVSEPERARLSRRIAPGLEF